MKIQIYTDGSCVTNPGPGGWAAVLVDEQDAVISKISGRESQSTNNRMELTAALQGIVYAYTILGADKGQVEILSDSSYVVNGFNTWILNWYNKQFARNGVDMPNAHLWRAAFTYKMLYHPTFKLIKGHSGIQYNEEADRLAKLAAHGYQ